MKKFVYVLIAFLAFSIGVIIYSLRPVVSPVSLCEISQHSELYRFNEIRIEANLDNVGINLDNITNTQTDFNGFAVSDFNEGCLTGADLDISKDIKEQLQKDNNLVNYINDIRQKKLQSYQLRSDYFVIGRVEITGTIEKRQETDTAGLIDPPPFVIKVSKIKQILPVRFMSYDEFQTIKNQK